MEKEEEDTLVSSLHEKETRPFYFLFRRSFGFKLVVRCQGLSLLSACSPLFVVPRYCLSSLLLFSHSRLLFSHSRLVSSSLLSSLLLSSSPSFHLLESYATLPADSALFGPAPRAMDVAVSPTPPPSSPPSPRDATRFFVKREFPRRKEGGVRRGRFIRDREAFTIRRRRWQRRDARIRVCRIHGRTGGRTDGRRPCRRRSSSSERASVRASERSIPRERNVRAAVQQLLVVGIGSGKRRSWSGRFFSNVSPQEFVHDSFFHRSVWKYSPSSSAFRCRIE